jgi:poly(3-hydroxybutyrate) depolymerase
MRCLVTALALLASVAAPARAQVFELVKPDHLNGKLQGRVIDFTNNHGPDRRIYSPILGRPRDLYVYLPPGYDPSNAYPLIVFLHGADIDEHAFLDPKVLKPIDFLISSGQIPPVVIAAPDGTYEGENRINSTHSLWVNGRGGRFADHIVEEVLPFMLRTYSIRPEREAHATLGISAGGFGAMSIAMKHRELFGAAATIAGPINMRYDNIQGQYSDDFDPATYREETVYDPDLVIARYYFGLLRRRVKQFLEPVYGSGPDMIAKIARDNPADLLFSTGLQPGELALYVNYPGRDNYNFDAHAQSFAWLAAQRGIAVELAEIPTGRHNLSYIERAQLPAHLWLGRHVLPAIQR